MRSSFSIVQLVVEVDGSYGEGGGQILRTSAMLATIMGVEMRVSNIRIRRPSPGLKAQHIAAVRALVEITGGSADGLRIGSKDVEFRPGERMKRKVVLDVGTAGSITLILQALIPAVSLRGGESHMEITGGTDTKWSPSTTYLEKVALPAFELAGVKAKMEVIRRGYYPRGGGLVKVDISPAKPVDSYSYGCPERYGPRIVSVYSKLPRHVGERQASSAAMVLERAGLDVVGTEVLEEPSISPGTSVLVYSAGDGPHFVGGDSIGERGVPAEKVGRRAARMFVAEVMRRSCVDVHLSDMLIPLLATQHGRFEFCTSELTSHMETNAYVTRRFIPDAQVKFRRDGEGVWVEIEGTRLIRWGR